MTINNKEIKHTIELCGTPFSLYYFKPPTFKNISMETVSEIKIAVLSLCNIYATDDKSYTIDGSMVSYVERKVQEIFELSKRSGCRVLVLNAPFNAIGVFVFGKRFSMVDNAFGGKDDGYYSIAFTGIRNLAMKCEQKMISEKGRTK